MMKKEGYETVFQWAKKKIENYPNCEQLALQLAAALDGYRLMKQLPDSEKDRKSVV